MHRRAFLDPRKLAEQAGQVIGFAHELTTSPKEHSEAEQTLVRYARPAMGTVFEIVLPFGHSLPTSFIHDAFDLIDEIESWMSIYRTDSEVSEVNRRAGREPVAISEELYQILRYSLLICQWTEGAFDVASGAIVDAWGFVRGPRRVPADAERQQALNHSGYQHVELGERTVRFLCPGLQLNFGSIGKGYALDAVAAYFDKHAPCQPVLLHGGKSSILALGSPPGHSHGWSVRIEHPWNPQGHLATLYLQNEAIATSAATFKHLVHEGRKLGHILDPRTGWPANGIASATARTSTAALADALSTAFFVMGVEETLRFCKGRELATAMLLPEGMQEMIRIK
ncbi:MAG: FAD:protein FMN transferase [Gemmatales bacterium]